MKKLLGFPVIAVLALGLVLAGCPTDDDGDSGPGTFEDMLGMLEQGEPDATARGKVGLSSKTSSDFDSFVNSIGGYQGWTTEMTDEDHIGMIWTERTDADVDTIESAVEALVGVVVNGRWPLSSGGSMSGEYITYGSNAYVCFVSFFKQPGSWDGVPIPAGTVFVIFTPANDGDSGSGMSFDEVLGMLDKDPPPDATVLRLTGKTSSDFDSFVNSIGGYQGWTTGMYTDEENGDLNMICTGRNAADVENIKLAAETLTGKTGNDWVKPTYGDMPDSEYIDYDNNEYTCFVSPFLTGGSLGGVSIPAGTVFVFFIPNNPQ
jgi:hypothetical protein